MLISKDIELCQDGITVSLTDESGTPINALKVSYSVYGSGFLVSGRDLPAISKGNGRYHATWNPDVPNGSYEITWRVFLNSTESHEVTESIFVVDKYAYSYSQGGVKPSAVPEIGSKTFLVGKQLTPEDLFIKFKDSNTGILTDPYLVYWTLLRPGNCQVYPRTLASKKSTGLYWVNWTVRAPSGDYEVLWDFQEKIGDPLMSKEDVFSVICPCNPIPAKCNCK